MVICTIATGVALKDLQLFLYTLELFNESPPLVYLLTDTPIHTNPPSYKGALHTKPTLDKYAHMNRNQMTHTKGITYRTAWEDFMMEKATVMEWAFAEGHQEVFFCDCDICFLGPLPKVPSEAKLGVSQHRIRPSDEQRFGIYNAGFVYSADPTFPAQWREAAHTSRYYDQTALEDIALKTWAAQLYEFPVQINYGWWRMYQGTQSPQALQSEWSIFRRDYTSGLCVSGEPLLSIHTHFGERRDIVTCAFNDYVFQYLCRLGKHPPAAALVKFLTREFQHLKSSKN